MQISSRIAGWAFATVASIGAFVGAADASVITSNDGFGGDAHVRSGANAGANFGSLTTLDIKADQADGSGDFNRKVYVLFDLTGAAELPTATSASLSFTMNSSAAGRVYNVFGLNDGTAGEIFNETTLTYGNAPANDAASGGGTYDTGTMTGGGVNNGLTTFIGTITVAGGSGSVQTITSASHPALLTFLNADTNDAATFILTAQTVQTAALDSLRSSEHATAASHPTLTIVPEPGGLMLAAGVGGLICLTRRRSARPSA